MKALEVADKQSSVAQNSNIIEASQKEIYALVGQQTDGFHVASLARHIGIAHDDGCGRLETVQVIRHDSITTAMRNSHLRPKRA